MLNPAGVIDATLIVQLHPRERRVLVAYYDEKRTAEEIATDEGISVRAVYYRLHKAAGVFGVPLPRQSTRGRKPGRRRSLVTAA